MKKRRFHILKHRNKLIDTFIIIHKNDIYYTIWAFKRFSLFKKYIFYYKSSISSFIISSILL